MALFGNPSSSHQVGQAARDALEQARTRIAVLLGGDADQVVLTGSGSESITSAIHGVFGTDLRGHMVTTGIEHSAVLNAAAALGRRGVEITIVPPGPSGQVDPERVLSAMRPHTRLVSVMHANNETGALQDVQTITAGAHAAGVLMHVDAVHTAGKIEIDALSADLVSVSAHKFGGPKGIGALRVMAGLQLEPLVFGGDQEGGRRAGTENLPAALGMAAAAGAAVRYLSDPVRRQECYDLRSLLEKQLLRIDGVQINAGDCAIPQTLSATFPGVRADALADVLDVHGICVSTGSACHAGQDSSSHVLTAMGLDREQTRSTVRFSLGAATNAANVGTAAETVIDAVHRLRRVAGWRLIAAGAVKVSSPR